MHLGGQGMRNYVDQYQPQGTSTYQPPGVMSGYNPNSNPQYPYNPQVPQPHMNNIFADNRQNPEQPILEIDGATNTHRMTNNRLKTLIHNRQNHREQLMPIMQESPYSSPVSNHYQSPYMSQQESALTFSNGPSDNSSSSLMQLQQLSPSSIETPKTPKEGSTMSWPTTPTRKTPEIQPVQRSPLKPSQNGHSTDIKPLSEPGKVVNGDAKRPPSALDTEMLDTKNAATLHPLHSDSDSKSEHNLPCDTNSNSNSNSVPSPRFGPGAAFVPPPYVNRHLSPHQTLGTGGMPLHPGSMPPPPNLPIPIHAGMNGYHSHHESNCDDGSSPIPPQQTTPTSPFLSNTTTSMNTYTSTTSTYSSRVSFSNATCMPTFAPTGVSNTALAYSDAGSTAHTYSGALYDGSLLPRGGGTMSCVDSGRIQDSLAQRANNFFHPHAFVNQDLPLHNLYQYQHQYQPGSYVPPPPYSNCTTPVAVVTDNQDFDHLDRIEKLRTNTKIDPPQCDCLKNKEVMPSEKLPYYTQLGSGSSVSAIRQLVEFRSGEKGSAIRIEKLLYSGKEGKTSQGCPLAKWIIRRSGPEEKLLTIIRHRPGHSCPTAYIIIALVAWEGVSEPVADVLYKTIVYKTVNFGIPTQRRCGTNEMRTCACQGLDLETSGASFSFGCSWSMYYNGCKFARSKSARKFKLTEKDEEQELEDKLQNLATDVADLYKKMVPESFKNQTEFEEQASDCRLGLKPGRPFSGVTACLDYCAHSHKDLHNMNNGCTVVVTLNKHKGFDKPEDEQLHVLPLYVIDSTDEHGSKEGQDKKIASGALEVLKNYPIDFRIRTTPLKPCKTRGRKPKDGFSPRKQAIQLAFKQLIASGKLHKIEVHPPDRSTSLDINLMHNRSSQLDFQHNRPSNIDLQHNRSGAFVPGYEPDTSQKCGVQEGTACTYYAGKHMSHGNYPDSYGVASRGYSCFSTNEPSTNPFPSAKASDGTNDSNNNYLPNTALPQRSYTPSKQSPNNSLYESNSATFIPQNSYGPSYHLSYNTHAYPSDTHYSYSTPHSYRYYTPNVPLKIPGNYSAGSGYYTHSPDKHYNDYFYTSNRPCNSYYGYGTGAVPGSYNQNYDFSPQQSVPYSQPSNCASLQYDNSYSNVSNSDDQPIKQEAQPESDSKANSQGNSPDNIYLRDLDSKSVNCFSKDKQPSPSSKEESKDQSIGCPDSDKPDLKFNTSPPFPQVPYFPHAKNYNYHLQQSNLLDLDNYPNSAKSTDINSNSTFTGGVSYKEGYEKSAPEWYSDAANNNKTAGKNDSYQETNPLGVMTQKYSSASVEEDDNFIDSTTFEGDEVYEGHSDNESSFQDVEVGGVAIALTHGSVLFECAKHELHATTTVKNPNRKHPTRISLVFYQHKNLNFENHGEAEWGQKMKDKRGPKNIAEVDFDISPCKKQCMPVEEMPTDVSPIKHVENTPNPNWVTVFSIAPLTVGAPYRP